MIARHQLAAYSPITFSDCLSAAAASVSRGGDQRSKLAALLRDEYDAERVILLGSGTQALQVAVASALAVAGGKTRVALPAYTCYDVASAAIGAGARIALYDIDPESLGPDCDSLERVLREGARIIVVAYSYGVPIDWDKVTDLALRYDATVIEDAAQGHGASWRGKKLGALSNI
ncbi:MAG TPA: aminotransferase class I/II-fold pyridoxal phosphate-dependent enzyme, partial [Polyangiaceae bacterium]|nr:aminotransferase class I/II-fold pyridoxal phosphate-dependent enzyme [Polyangiaceae bacterium]